MTSEANPVAQTMDTLLREYNKLQQEHKEAAEEIRRLREALQPFADAMGIAMADGKPQSLNLLNFIAFYHLRYSAFKAARQALSPTGD